MEKKEQADLKVLFALMAMSGKSDREIAKTLKMSNSSLSRKRKKLEKAGYIKDYMVMPDFSKMGLNVIVFSFCSTSDLVPPENQKYVKELVKNLPELLCLFEDHDAQGTNWFGVTVHKDYDEFVDLFRKVMEDLTTLNPQYMPRVESKRLVFHTNKPHPKPFSLRQLENIFQNKTEHKNIRRPING